MCETNIYMYFYLIKKIVFPLPFVSKLVALALTRISHVIEQHLLRIILKIISSRCQRKNDCEYHRENGEGHIFNQNIRYHIRYRMRIEHLYVHMHVCVRVCETAYTASERCAVARANAIFRS